MYRTARLAIYDVLDTVFCNIVITEYPETPGACQPDVYAYSASVPSTGEDDPTIWAWKALQALQAELDSA